MLTAAEEQELAQLEASVGQQKSSGLSPDEEAELAQLESQFAGVNELKEKVLNEMPEGFEGRFTAKNFGGDPVASFNYLQKQNPDFELKTDKSGEVLARKRGTKDWGRMDPKGFDWRDLTDVAYDVPAAVAQGVATAASGVAGAAATLPAAGIGAIPAAMAGGAGSGVALEGVRQGIGSLMGIEDNVSAEDLKLAAATGAISPLLFGTGAGAKEVVKYGAKEIAKGGAKETAKDLLKAQSGLIGKGYDKVAGYVGPKIGALASGENETVIKKAATMLEDLKAADKNPEVRTAGLKTVAQQVPQKIKDLTTETGKRMEDMRNMIDDQPGLVLTGEGAAIRGTGTIPRDSFAAPFMELAEKMRESGLKTEAQIKDFESLRKIVNSEFKGLPENLTAAQVDNLRKRFKERAEQYGLQYGKMGQAVGGNAGNSAIDAQIANAFETSRRNMTDAIINRLEQMDPKLKDEYLALNDQYSYLKTTAKDVNANFSSPKSVASFLGRATKDDVEASKMLDIQNITGIDLEDLAVRDQAFRTFSKPSSEIRSLMGSTSTSRSIPLAVAGGTAGYYAGQQSGGDMSPFLMAIIGSGLGSKAASPAMLRKYMQMNQAVRTPTNLPGYKALPYLMMNPENHDQGEK